MTRRKSVEERVRELEENRESHIKRKVEEFERRLRATYQAKIDLLREKGLPETRTQRKSAGGGIKEMMDRARERSVFFRTRYYEHMGLSPEEAGRRAESDYERYRMGWTRAMAA